MPKFITSGVSTPVEDVAVEIVISKEQIRHMALDAVARRMSMKRVQADPEDGPDAEDYEVDSGSLAVYLKAAADAVVGEAAPALVDAAIKKAIDEQIAKGFSTVSRYGGATEPKTLNQMFQEAFVTEQRHGNYGNERTMTRAQRIVEEKVEEAMKGALKEELEQLRAQFRKALTDKFTAAASEALRKAVMDAGS